jgi:hypothetical protein
MKSLSRRQFLARSAAAGAVFSLPRISFAAGSSFKIGVISDEISEDFDHACYVVSKEYGLGYVARYGARIFRRSRTHRSPRHGRF